MLHFSPEFFEAEYRENFLVDTTMKTLWAAEMELLNDIAIICQKYNLQYYVYAGTMLGTVRHQGFIPWDDDIDIALKRPDYTKLMSVLPNELPDTYRVYHALSEVGHDQFWGCVTNADTISIEEDRLKKFHGCPFWVGIDVFPLDFIPRNESEAILLKSLITVFEKGKYYAKKKEKTDEDEEELINTLNYLENNLNIRFDYSVSLANQLCRFENALAMSYTEEEGDYLTHHPSAVKKNDRYYHKKLWETVKYMPFEILRVPVPVGYDEILTKLYGDYHSRERTGSDHEYPYYKAQLQQMRDMISRMEKNER